MIDLKNIRICTLNVRSLTDDSIRLPFFAWLRIENKYDIICLQEVCVPASRMTSQRIQKWTNECGGHARAIFTKHAALILNNSRLTMSAHSPDPDGRIIIADVAFDGDTAIDNIVRVANVYAPANRTATPSPAAFIRDFPVNLITQAPHRVVLGDFNFVKDPLVDKFPPLIDNNNPIRQSYIDLLDRLGVQDLAPEPTRDTDGIVEMTHYTRLSASSESMSRIDYICASPSLVPAGKDMKYRVYSDTQTRSDHRLVKVLLNSTKPLPQDRSNHSGKAKAAPSLDSRVLKDPNFRKQIREILKSMKAKRTRSPGSFPDVGVFWDACKKRFLLAGQQFRNKKRIENRRERVRLQRTLRDADRKLDSRPGDPTAVEDRLKAIENLHTLQSDHIDHVATLAKVKWLEEGERASPFFTERLKATSTRKSIASLKDSDGESTSDPERMEQIAVGFYGTLYTSQETDAAAQRTLLEAVTMTIPDQDRLRLDQDLTLEEIVNSIDSMEYRSSPGSDGLPYEFYKTFKDELAPVLLELFNDIGNDRAPPPASHRQALTTLIFKKGGREEMKNYRPISLIQTDYKIFTKALTNRINPVARGVIHPWQTGFIPKRHGLDNALLIDLLSDHVHDGSLGEAAILSLDQEKAYDRVEWDYLHQVLERYGFGPKVRHWVRCCYSDLSAKILLNGRQSAPYTLQRGLRQGDPLAPILFNFVLEPFLQHYNSISSGVRTANMPFKVAAFADDTTLGMRPGDERHVLAAIDLHERASGAKVNRDKTRLIPLTTNALTSIHLPGFASTAFEEAFEHLGVVIQPGGRDTTTIERRVMVDLERTCSTWSKRRVSFQGRVTILNTYLLSKLWYTAPFYDYSPEFYRTLDNLMKRVLWGTERARVSLAWIRRPRDQGGWNLINPRTQIAAFKAKWLARWSTENPRWKFLFTTEAHKALEARTVAGTVDYLRKPRPPVKVKNAPGPPVTAQLTRHQDSDDTRSPVVTATVAFSQLDVKSIILPAHHPKAADHPGLVRVYAGDNLVKDFTIKCARKWMDDQVFLRRGRTDKVQLSQMPLKNRSRLNYRVVTPIPDDLWKRFFQRLHSRHRWPSEKEPMYLYAHKAINTDGIKMLWDVPDRPSGECRRCLQEKSPRPVARETRGHALFECPSVNQLWHEAIAWLSRVFPRLGPSMDLNEVLLTWPSIEHVPPLAIHLHSAIYGTIYRTYCKIGDGEKLYRNQTHIMSIVLFKQRAKVELARALYSDQRRHETATTPELQAELAENPDMFYKEMRKIWHFPPHIKVTREGVSFGELWGHQEEAELEEDSEEEEEPQPDDD